LDETGTTIFFGSVVDRSSEQNPRRVTHDDKICSERGGGCFCEKRNAKRQMDESAAYIPGKLPEKSGYNRSHCASRISSYDCLTGIAFLARGNKIMIPSTTVKAHKLRRAALECPLVGHRCNSLNARGLYPLGKFTMGKTRVSGRRRRRSIRNAGQ